MAGAAGLPARIGQMSAALGAGMAGGALSHILRIGDLIVENSAIVVARQTEFIALMDLMDQPDEFTGRKAAGCRGRVRAEIHLAAHDIGAAGHNTAGNRNRRGTTVCALIGMAHHAVFRVVAAAVRSGDAELVVAGIAGALCNDVMLYWVARKNWIYRGDKVSGQIQRLLIERASGNGPIDPDRQTVGIGRNLGDAGNVRYVLIHGVGVGAVAVIHEVGCCTLVSRTGGR